MQSHDDLIALQEADDALARLRSDLDDVEEALRSDTTVVEAAELHAGCEARVREIEGDQRGLEAETESLSDKVATEEGRLYDASPKTPKELEALQHEVDLLKDALGRLEDRLLEIMTALEEATARRDKAREGLDRAEAAWAEASARLSADAERLRAEIASGAAAREGISARITAGTLTRYDDLRRRKAGLAVVRLQAGACTGCRVAVPNSIRRRAQEDGTPETCPNCERLMVIAS